MYDEFPCLITMNKTVLVLKSLKYLIYIHYSIVSIQLKKLNNTDLVSYICVDTYFSMLLFEIK